MPAPLRQRCALLAAELVLGRAQPEVARALIDAAIDTGFMSEHCLDALTRPPRLEVLRPAFDDLMREQGLDWPQPVHAYRQVATARLSAIRAGELDPLNDLREVIELSWESEELLPDLDFAGDGLDVTKLLGLWSCIGDLADMQYPVFDGEEGDAAWQALRRHVLLAVDEYLERHGELRPLPIP